MAKHAATPNSECTEHVNPAAEGRQQASAEPHGTNGAGGDHSRERIVTSK